MKEKNNIFKQIDTMISVVALIVLICITFIGVVFVMYLEHHFPG